ncbi:peptidyl-prolyl cis-trans isomerase E [Olea europaea subsp. europaea]|uniref:Peptidyl-prolyl cis-trans isomerase E n=1 Tax=Olea europaea subsp. europaea TaxID=158383 RepID=A0A8S0TTQ1_OLEEU|nr:peptidyl-prolyl cis-trans isomerase E [Olea europaea subsp. europaea]
MRDGARNSNLGAYDVYGLPSSGGQLQDLQILRQKQEKKGKAVFAFIPFGDIKDVKTPLDQATQKHRSFGFVTFLEREDAATAMDNMDGEELYDRVLTINYALPEKIKGGEQGWAAQPIWADADTYKFDAKH